MSFLHKFKHTFHLTFWEAIIALAAIVVFTVLRFTISTPPLWLIIFGFIVGAWLAFRPSEWAVEGLDSGAKYIGFSDYIAGILSSLASNLPEAVIAVFLVLADETEIAVITVLSAAGFNTLILGFSIVIATRKRGFINVPGDLEKKEAPIIRWAIVALLMTALFGIIEITQISETEKAVLGWPLGVLLAASYVIYLIFLLVKKKGNDNNQETAEKEVNDEQGAKEAEEPKLSKLMTVVFLILGFVGIFYAGETLTFATEHVLEHYNLNYIIAALILGATGAIPEHGIAMVLAVKDEVDMALGNAISGILQTTLLIFGIIGMIVVIELTPFVILQLAAAAVVLWFVKRSIFDDRKFDIFEGIMIILLQLFVFAILFEEIILFG